MASLVGSDCAAAIATCATSKIRARKYVDERFMSGLGFRRFGGFRRVESFFLLALQGAQQREENNVADGAGIGQEHGEAVDADAFACGRRQAVRERADVVFVHLVGLFVATGALGELAFEAAALLLGIVELAEGVANFEAAHEDLEALDPVGVFLGLALV